MKSNARLPNGQPETIEYFLLQFWSPLLRLCFGPHLKHPLFLHQSQVYLTLEVE